MYFTRAQLTGNVLTESKIYFSTGGGEGWKGARKFWASTGPVLQASGYWRIVRQGSAVLRFRYAGRLRGFDIYYATKTGEGTFSDPVNLGDVINTLGDDETPYYRDGTLYFSSTTGPGTGGFDIFLFYLGRHQMERPLNMVWL